MTKDEPGLEAGTAPGPALEGEAGQTQRPHSGIKSAVEWFVVVVVAVAVALVFRAFILQSFWIKSGSMETTLDIRDRVMVNRLSYRFGDPEPNQIIVFRSVEPAFIAAGESDLIKRIIGVGGDVVEGRDGRVWLNGEPLDEPYLDEGQLTSDFGPVEIPPDHLWMMGDNRIRSSDSRSFGPIPEDNVIGRAFFLYWPLGRAGSP